MRPLAASELAEGRRRVRERAAAALDNHESFKYGRGVTREVLVCEGSDGGRAGSDGDCWQRGPLDALDALNDCVLLGHEEHDQ